MISWQHFKVYFDISTSKSIITRALKISLIVGTALNLINQYHAIISFNFVDLNIAKILLTYSVPYLVTTYTATALKLEFQIGTKASIEADLVCGKCKAQIHLKENELIPECPVCGIKTKWRLK
ncbi:MAG: nitrate/nitrite transporter NrtS [Sulfurimonas sp.]